MVILVEAGVTKMIDDPDVSEVLYRFVEADRVGNHFVVIEDPRLPGAALKKFADAHGEIRRAHLQHILRSYSTRSAALSIAKVSVRVCKGSQPPRKEKSGETWGDQSVGVGWLSAQRLDAQPTALLVESLNDAGVILALIDSWHGKQQTSVPFHTQLSPGGCGGGQLAVNLQQQLLTPAGFVLAVADSDRSHSSGRLGDTARHAKNVLHPSKPPAPKALAMLYVLRARDLENLLFWAMQEPKNSSEDWTVFSAVVAALLSSNHPRATELASFMDICPEAAIPLPPPPSEVDSKPAQELWKEAQSVLQKVHGCDGTTRRRLNKKAFRDLDATQCDGIISRMVAGTHELAKALRELLLVVAWAGAASRPALGADQR